MAKALKIGDQVTVKEPLSFSAKSPAYKAGLKSVNPGQVGQVVGPGEGRSVIVAFKGIQAAISSQRLERASEPAPVKSKPGRPKRTEPRTARAVAVPTKAEDKPIIPTTQPKRSTEAGSQLVTTIANKVLLSGGMKAEPDTLIQLRLAELPGDVQQQVQALIEAKLALEPQAIVRSERAVAPTPAEGSPQRGRRSRKGGPKSS